MENKNKNKKICTIKNKQFFLKILPLIFISSNALSESTIHIVKKDETLSEILYNLNLRPVYGKKGYLAIVLAQNKYKIKKHKIFPGNRIVLPVLEGNAPKAKEHVLEIKEQVSKSEAPTLEVATPSKAPASLPPTDPSQPTIIKEDHEQYYFVRFSPQISWMKVIANDSNAYQISEISALSKANPGGLLNFGIQVREDIKLHAFSYLSGVNFYENDTYTLSKSSFFRQTYGLGAEYKLKQGPLLVGKKSAK
jgi:hypothetical protein